RCVGWTAVADLGPGRRRAAVADLRPRPTRGQAGLLTRLDQGVVVGVAAVGIGVVPVVTALGATRGRFGLGRATFGAAGRVGDHLVGCVDAAVAGRVVGRVGRRGTVGRGPRPGRPLAVAAAPGTPAPAPRRGTRRTCRTPR